MAGQEQSLAQVEQRLSALDGRQHAIVHTKRIEDEMTAGEWRDMLAPLAHFDRVVDANKAGCGMPVWIGIVGVLLAPFTFGISLVAVIVALIVRSNRLQSRMRELDLYNGMRDLALPLLDLVAQDVRDGDPVRMKMDLGDPVADAKRIEPPVPVQDGGGITTSFYENPWLELQASLASGARLEVHLTDVIRKRIRERRNARGRLKIKTKYRAKHQVRVKLTLPAAEKADRPVIKASRSAMSAGLEPGIAPLNDVVAAIGEVFGRTGG